MKFNLKKFIIIVCWLILWHLVYLIVNNNLIIEGPINTAKALISILGESKFWYAVANSSVKILMGFFFGCLFGFFLASISHNNRLFGDFLNPAISLSKSVPVASFVILALIITGSSYLSVLISFIIVFPQTYTAILSGYDNIDMKMTEFAQVYRIPRLYKFMALYLPALTPFILSSFKVSLGMAWKSGIAAEVIGVAKNSIGEKLYMAKIYLLTDELFANTIVIILLSILTEKILMTTLIPFLSSKRIFNGNYHKKNTVLFKSSSLKLMNICKSFDERKVLENISLQINPSDVICIMGESGSGKSTLLRIIAGLLKADKGDFITEMNISPGIVFQDGRIFEELNPIQNIRLISDKSENEIICHLRQLLDEKSLKLPVSNLSGGMKRRVCICMAIISKSNILVFDEPFSALDSVNKSKTVDYINKYKGERAVVMTSHQQEDAELLSATIYRLNSDGLYRV